jgi:hypothetical protein
MWCFLPCDFVNIVQECVQIKVASAELGISPHGSQFKYQPSFEISGLSVLSTMDLRDSVFRNGKPAATPLASLEVGSPAFIEEVYCTFSSNSGVVTIQSREYCARPKNPIETR